MPGGWRSAQMRDARGVVVAAPGVRRAASSPSRSIRPAPARSWSASTPTACATPTSGPSSTATGARRSRCCSATRAPASWRRSARASTTWRPATRAPGLGGPVRACAGVPAGPPRRCAHGWEQPPRLHAPTGGAGRHALDRNAGHPHGGPRRAGHSRARRTRPRRLPARVRCIDRARGGAEHRPGVARRHGRGGGTGWYRPRRVAGCAHGRRRAADRDRPRRGANSSGRRPWARPT